MRVGVVAWSASFLILAASLPAQSLTAQAAAPAPAPPVESPGSEVAAPANGPFVQSEARAVVAKLGEQLEQNFVFPDAAKQYAAMLRANLAAGKYDSFPDAAAFAKAVTADLQSIHKDQHLALHGPNMETGGARRAMAGMGRAGGITKSGWLADGVAYISFDLFPGDEATLSGLRTFLDTHKDAKTLIIDARGHHGGGLAEMGLMFPYLFARPTVLVDMDTREAIAARNRPEPDEAKYLRTVKGPPGVVRNEQFVVPAKGAGALQRASVYLLTSHATGSAAEHLALSLKRTHRATLIGETTHGAGHYGGFVPLGYGYSAFIPVGRTFDPDTNWDWEGVGVAPDIAVPADHALDEALRRAGVKVSAETALASLH
ncbi:MAG: S41 family peptidase [Sphingomonas sp.]